MSNNNLSTRDCWYYGLPLDLATDTPANTTTIQKNQESSSGIVEEILNMKPSNETINQ